MNFVNKSTFKNIKPLLRRIHHSVWILLFNGLTSFAALFVYLRNIILPATIGSRYYGHYYVAILETGALLLLSTTIYALIFRIEFAFSRLKRYLSRMMQSERQPSSISSDITAASENNIKQ